MKRDVLIATITVALMTIFFFLVAVDILFGIISLDPYSLIFRLRCGWGEFSASALIFLVSIILYSSLVKNYINYDEYNDDQEEQS